MERFLFRLPTKESKEKEIANFNLWAREIVMEDELIGGRRRSDEETEEEQEFAEGNHDGGEDE